MFNRAFLIASMALGAFTAGCTDESGSPPPPDTTVSIHADVNGTERLVIGTLDELVTPYTRDRSPAFVVDGVDTNNPGLLVGAFDLTIIAEDGDALDFGRTGDGSTLASANLATPVTIVWSDTGAGVTLTAGEHRISLELHGVDDRELVERWLGGVTVDLIRNDPPRFMVDQQGWVFFGKLAKLGWKKAILLGGGVLGLSVGYTVVLGQINIRQCRTLVINACRTEARNECANAGLVIKSVSGKCTADIFGSVEASCDFVCQPRPPAPPPPPPNPQPPVQQPHQQRALDGMIGAASPGVTSMETVAVEVDHTDVIGEPPPECTYEHWTYDDDGNVSSYSTGPSSCPGPSDGTCSYSLCHNEYGCLECQSAVGDCDTFEFPE